MSEIIYYTGVGSRSTPDIWLELFYELGYVFAKEGCILRSGHAPGADTAFENGCDKAKGSKEIYLPWEKFNKSDSKLILDKDNKVVFDYASSIYGTSWRYKK